MAGEKQLLEIFGDATKTFYNVLLNQVQDAAFCLDKDRKIVFWNKGAETTTGFDRAEILGKQSPEDYALLSDAEGRPLEADEGPIAATLKDGTIRSAEMYVLHKEGYRIPASFRVVPIFKDDGEILGAAAVFTDTSPKVAIPLGVPELERMGLIDSETGITNRKYLEMCLAGRITEFQKYNLPFGLAFVDVDNFAKITERFGRFNAAKVLRMIARTIHKNIRYFDIVGRWEQDEFLVIFLNIDESRLDIVSNKLRLLIAESYISIETGILNATVSMGASIVQRYDGLEGLVKRTEQLMMHSKWRGRNKVSMSFVTNEKD